MSESYAQRLNREHRERIARLYGPPKVQMLKPEAPKDVIPRPAPEVKHKIKLTDEQMVWAAKRLKPWGVMSIILQEVATKYGISAEGLRSHEHPMLWAEARREFCYRVLMETTLSYAAVGRYFGGRDHTSIIHAARAHQLRHPESVPIKRAKHRSHGRVLSTTKDAIRMEKDMTSQGGPGRDPDADDPRDRGDPLPGQQVDPSEVVHPSGPGKMGDEDDPRDFGKPKRPVDPSEIEQPSGPGNMGDT